MKLTVDLDSISSNSEYPILLWGGYTYWPLSYIDQSLFLRNSYNKTTNNVVESDITKLLRPLALDRLGLTLPWS